MVKNAAAFWTGIGLRIWGLVFSSRNGLEAALESMPGKQLRRLCHLIGAFNTVSFQSPKV